MLPWMFLTPAAPWVHHELLLVPHSSTGCSVGRCGSWLALTHALLLLTPFSKAGICCGQGRAALFGLCPHESLVSPALQGSALL